MAVMNSPDKNNYLEFIYRDEFIAVVNKPGGLLSIPGKGPDKQDCVTSRLKNIIPESIEQPSVHRLDMATSGLLVLALTKESHKNLSIQFQNREVGKKYIALLEGIVAGENGRIELPFRLDVDNRPYQIYDPVQGKNGITEWEKIETTNGKTRVEFTPLTGRTHQLRIHAAHKLGLNTPIVGDPLYGNGNEGDKLFLHASEITFAHPIKKTTLTFKSSPDF